MALMREVGKEIGAYDDGEEDSSDLSGYHSDSDSAIMTSGNSPFVTPRARYNFLSRSGMQNYLNTCCIFGIIININNLHYYCFERIKYSGNSSLKYGSIPILDFFLFMLQHACILF